jgi:hypothetical protein
MIQEGTPAAGFQDRCPAPMPGQSSTTSPAAAGAEPAPEPAAKSRPCPPMTLGAAVADLAPKLAPNDLAHARVRQDGLTQL